jgi:leucyl aminopeptidase
MQINFKATPDKLHSRISVFLISSELNLSDSLKKIDSQHNSIITKFLEVDKNFKGKLATQSSIIITPDSNNIILIGMGALDKLDRKNLNTIGATITNSMNKLKIDKCDIFVENLKLQSIDQHSAAAYIAEGIKLRNYKFNKYYVDKKDDHKLYFATADLFVHHPEVAANNFEKISITIDGVNYARDLVTEPGNVIYPESFADKCLELSSLGLKVRVIDVKEMQKLGMGSLLGVAQGSAKEPKLVVLEWWGNPKGENVASLAILGKGVTFDTGGINLKGTKYISDMKYDMAGAAVVAGLMKALAESKTPKNVVGFLGLVENMPSGTAQRPGDVVVSMSGQTIEVDNTDAEGRLVLADVMWFAQKEYKCNTIIDLATLTGAVVMALGDEFAGLFSNSDELSNNLIASGKDVNELLWRLPLTQHYDSRINSDIADVRNTGRVPGCASSITAAHFIQRFLVDKNNHWAHLDIAGVAWSDNGDLTNGLKGATGYGVRLLEHYINNYYKPL